MSSGLVRSVIAGRYDIAEPAVDAAPTSTETLVRQLRSVSRQDIVFVGIDRTMLGETLRRDPAVIAELGLEPMNIGVSAAPLYLFAQAETAAALRKEAGTSRTVVYVDRLGALQPADVKTLLDPLLRTKTVVSRLASPRELARRLLASGPDRADVVAVHDDDPSAFRSDFVDAYEEMRPRGDAARLQSLALLVFPADDADFRARPIGVSQGGLPYAIVRYDDVAFSDAAPIRPADGQSGVVALPRPGTAADNGILLLTNLRGRVADDEYQRLRRLIGYAHLAALYRSSPGQSRCARSPITPYRVLLLDAYRADRRDLVRGLAIWSDLQLALSITQGVEQAQVQDQIRIVDAMLAREQNFRVGNKEDWKVLANRLSAGASVREQFSGHAATLYRLAITDVRSALTTTGPDSTRLLAAARAKLVELIRKGVTPACTAGAAEGLFQARELDPFFYLGLIEAQLAIEAAVRP